MHLEGRKAVACDKFEVMVARHQHNAIVNDLKNLFHSQTSLEVYESLPRLSDIPIAGNDTFYEVSTFLYRDECHYET